MGDSRPVLTHDSSAVSDHQTVTAQLEFTAPNSQRLPKVKVTWLLASAATVDRVQKPWGGSLGRRLREQLHLCRPTDALAYLVS